MRGSHRHHYSGAISASSFGFLKAPKRSLSSMAAALEEEGPGVTFRQMSGAQIRFKGVRRVSLWMLTSTVRGFEWEISEGTEWKPFEVVDRGWLRFTTRSGTLGDHTYIGFFQLEVTVIVSREDNVACEEKAPNINLDDIHTPRSSASSTR